MIFGLLGLLFFMGCGNSNSHSQKLAITITNQDDSLQVTGYHILDETYEKNYQQGRYQIHLMDANGKVVQKISVDQLSFSSDRNVPLSLVVPLLPNLHHLKLYKLDGSSGHYQLNDSQPLLQWQLPDRLSQTPTTNSK